jgi:ATP-dependent RNA helicase DDX56/DBP9
MSDVENDDATPALPTFAATFNLDSRIFKAIAKQRFVHATPVQADVLPPAMAGRDLLVRAKTGSGKTLAYVIPALQNILLTKSSEALNAMSSRSSRSSSSSSAAAAAAAVVSSSGREVRGLILVPTRELCDQVRKTIKQLLFYSGELIRVMALSGAVALPVEATLLREEGADIVVATPARVVQHLTGAAAAVSGGGGGRGGGKKGASSRGSAAAGSSLAFGDRFQLLVVDEADLVLSHGYEADVRVIVDTYLPRIHQTILVSATLTPEVESLRALILNDAVVVDKTEDEAAAAGSGGDKLSQFYLRCPTDDKFLLTYALLKLNVIKGKTLFFVNDIDSCFRLKLFLEQFSIKSAVLNNELPYNSRTHILQAYNRGMFDYLIATDEAIAEQEVPPGSSDDEDSEDDDEEDSDDSDDDDEDDDDEDGEDDDDDDDDDDDEKKEKKSSKSGKLKAFNKARKRRLAKREKVRVMKVERAKREMKSLNRGKNASDNDGVARGVDFQGVRTVVNFDFPSTVRAYIHRVGRTARGGSHGTALSLVGAVEFDCLDDVMEDQTPEQTDALVTPECLVKYLPYKKEDVEGFRYRVDDCIRAVNKTAVRDARLKEVRLELVNSHKLRSHFEDNPRELDLLRHDKLLRTATVQPHLQAIPSYLMPAGSAAAGGSSGKKRKAQRAQMGSQSTNRARKYKRNGGVSEDAVVAALKQRKAGLGLGDGGGDPLKTFRFVSSNDGSAPLRAGTGSDKFANSAPAKKVGGKQFIKSSAKKAQQRDAERGVGKKGKVKLSSSKVSYNSSLAGRRQWKEKRLTKKRRSAKVTEANGSAKK